MLSLIRYFIHTTKAQTQERSFAIFDHPPKPANKAAAISEPPADSTRISRIAATIRNICIILYSCLETLARIIWEAPTREGNDVMLDMGSLPRGVVYQI